MGAADSGAQTAQRMYFRRSSSSTIALRRSRTTSPFDEIVCRPAIRKLEQHVLEQRRHHRVQPARADVLHALVHQRGDARDLGDAVRRELELRAVGLDERGVLLGQRVLRLRHDADEILLR